MKRNIYIALAAVLGIMFAALVCALLEYRLIITALARSSMPYPYHYLSGSGYLPLYIWGAMLFAGAAGGLYLGQVWWRIVYIEKRHWRKGWRKDRSK